MTPGEFEVEVPLNDDPSRWVARCPTCEKLEVYQALAVLDEEKGITRGKMDCGCAVEVKGRPGRPKPIAEKSRVSKLLPIVKIDPVKRLAYGWGSVIQRDGRAVVDLQDDVIGLDDLERAAHSFMARGGTLKAQHAGNPIGQVVESFLATPESLAKLGLSPEAIESAPIGWWVGVKVSDDATWTKVQDGTLKGFSIGGRANRKEIV
jgi:hypothetical protein